MPQITKNQHYVPRFYLKRFARNGQIQVCDVRTRRILRAYGLRSVCRERFFYAVETGVQDEPSQAFEDVFGRIESEIANALPGIIERALALQLTNGDLDILAYFMSVQWLRTPSFREQLQKMQSDLIKWMCRAEARGPGFKDLVRRAEGCEISDEQIEEMKRFIESDRYSIGVDNLTHLRFMCRENVDGYHNLLLAKKWRIIHSEEPYYFITTDNPVVEWNPPTRGILGRTFLERGHLLALTPGILIDTVRPDSMDPAQQPVDRLSYHTANGKGVLVFNRVLATHAHKFAYARQREELERLLEEG